MNMELVFPEDVRDAQGATDQQPEPIRALGRRSPPGGAFVAYGLSRLKSTGWLYARARPWRSAVA